MKKYNFCAGPSILPQEVFEEASRAILDFEGSGLSLLEISHRSDAFGSVIAEARALTRELLDITSSHEVLFMQGGASSQFYMVPANFLTSQDTAGYIDTGTWSTKALKEAKRYGEISTLASSEDQQYTYIPKDYNIPSDLRYLHITTNNTIRGTEYQELPQTDVPIIADMSSNIFSRNISVSDYALIYAGAQKNLGPAGVTMVIIDKGYLAKYGQDTPSMLNYGLFVEKGSMFNTPPVFAIYVSMLTLRWIKKNGGVAALEQRNIQKANTLYKALDESTLFSAPVAVQDRSRMNATFQIADQSLQDAFLSTCEDAGCVALKGHRSVGGFRASMYNAMELEGVQVLADVIRDFDQRHA